MWQWQAEKRAEAIIEDYRPKAPEPIPEPSKPKPQIQAMKEIIVQLWFLIRSNSHRNRSFFFKCRVVGFYHPCYKTL